MLSGGGPGAESTALAAATSNGIASPSDATLTIGKLKENAEPTPSSDSTQMCPDIASTSVRAM